MQLNRIYMLQQLKGYDTKVSGSLVETNSGVK